MAFLKSKDYHRIERIFFQRDAAYSGHQFQNDARLNQVNAAEILETEDLSFWSAKVMSLVQICVFKIM